MAGHPAPAEGRDYGPQLANAVNSVDGQFQGPLRTTALQQLAAYGAGDYETAVALLEPIAPEVIRIGGSHAQREVFEETLLDSYLRAGRFEQAEAMLKARLDRRPNPRDERWLARVHAR